MKGEEEIYLFDSALIIKKSAEPKTAPSRSGFSVAPQGKAKENSIQRVYLLTYSVGLG